jgi:ABC-type multidrug transport system fused ATPase/permease subunit
VVLIGVVSNRVDSSEVWRWLGLLAVNNFMSFISYRVMEISTQFTYYNFAQKYTQQYIEQLCRIDLPDYYNKEVRAEVDRLHNGYNWQLPNATNSVLRLVHGTLNTIATIVTVGFVAWWVAPIFALLLIPVFIYEAKAASVNWFVWDE